MDESAAVDPLRAPPRPATVLRASLVVFGLAFGVYLLCPVKEPTDSAWAVPTAQSLLTKRSADLDQYDERIEQRGGFQTFERHGHHYYEVPLGVAVVSLPFVAVAQMIDRVTGSGLNEIQGGDLAPPLDPFLGSLFTALAVVVVFRIGVAATAEVRVAFVGALVFAFATPALSTTSRSLWMHGPSMLALSLALLWLLEAPRRPVRFIWAGVALGLACMIRPTNIVAALVFTAFVALCHRTQVVRFVAGGAAVGLLFAGLNLGLYGTILQPYTRLERLDVSTTAAEAIAANLVSPARGLLVYCPFLILGAFGVVLRVRSGDFGGLDTALLVIIGVHLIVVSLFPKWWAGWSFGPRFMSDILPFATWFLFPVLAVALARGQPVSASHRVLGLVLVVLVAFAGFVHLQGATNAGTFTWNITPIDVDRKPSRVWDWGDLPFLRSNE